MGKEKPKHQGLMEEIYGILKEVESFAEWKIHMSGNSIVLQYISPYIEENTDIYVDFYDNFVEITVLEAIPDGDNDGEPLTTITRIFNDGVVEYEKEISARGYRVTIELPEWKDPDYLANTIAGIIDLLAHL